MKFLRLFPQSALSLVSFLLLIVFLSVPAIASIQNVAVVPPSPSACDSIMFHAAGYFPDGCWHFDGYDVSILAVASPAKFSTFHGVSDADLLAPRGRSCLPACDRSLRGLSHCRNNATRSL